MFIFLVVQFLPTLAFWAIAPETQIKNTETKFLKFNINAGQSWESAIYRIRTFNFQERGKKENTLLRSVNNPKGGNIAIDSRPDNGVRISLTVLLRTHKHFLYKTGGPFHANAATQVWAPLYFPPNFGRIVFFQVVKRLFNQTSLAGSCSSCLQLFYLECDRVDKISRSFNVFFFSSFR